MADSSKKIAVILSGNGFMDGSEVREAVMTLYAIENNGATYHCFAPDIDQMKVVNHLTGATEERETRNVLVESARIARGAIKPLKDYKAGDFDALILPGGFGAALNLCDFGIKGPDCTVNGDVEMAVKATHQAGKPIGALCIAPALVAKLLGSEGVEVTIGTDSGTAEAIEKTGATHINCSSGDIVIDDKTKVVTAPCYMLDPKITDVATEADKVVKAVLEMAQ